MNYRCFQDDGEASIKVLCESLRSNASLNNLSLFAG